MTKDSGGHGSEKKKHHAYGWNTSKTEQGYKWSVHGVTHGEPLETLHTGVAASRGQAMRMAKKHVMPYRRSNKI